MADNQGDEGRPESNSGDLDKSLQERIKRRAQADWPGPGAWAGWPAFHAGYNSGIFARRTIASKRVGEAWFCLRQSGPESAQRLMATGNS